MKKLTTKVKAKDKDVSEVMDPEAAFWELKEYVKEYGDPKKNKAKVVQVTAKNGKVLRGYHRTCRCIPPQIGPRARGFPWRDPR